MARGRFAVWAALIFAVFLGLKLGFPFLLLALVEVSDCRGQGGACGALGLVAGMFGGLALLVGFLLACVIVFWRRLSHAQLSPLWLVAVASFVLGSSAFVYGAGNFWAANFSAGLLGYSFPYTLLALLGFAVFLSTYVHVDPASLSSPINKYAWVVASFAAGLIAVVHSIKILGILGMIPLVGDVFLSLSITLAKALIPIQMASAALPVSLDLLATIMFLIALVVIVLSGRTGGDRGEPSPRNPPESRPGSAHHGARSFGQRSPESAAR